MNSEASDRPEKPATMFTKTPVRLEFLRFAIVGGGGFLIDAGVLSALIHLGQGVFVSRLLSFSTAVLFTWLLNHFWSFRQSAPKSIRNLASYLAIQTTGAAINFSIFFSLMWAWPILHRYPTVPLAIASILVMMFNFSMTKKFALNKNG